MMTKSYNDSVKVTFASDDKDKVANLNLKDIVYFLLGVMLIIDVHNIFLNFTGKPFNK